MILVRKPSAVQPTWNPAARPTGSTETAWTNGSAGTPPSGSLTSRAVWRPPTWVVFISVRPRQAVPRSEEHTSELQSLTNLVCRLLLEKKKKQNELNNIYNTNQRQHITSAVLRL